MKLVRRCCLAVLVLAFPALSRAGDFSSGPLRETIQQGLDALYNLNFAAAAAVFQGMAQQSPNDPLGPFAVSLTRWWELETSLGEFTDEQEDRFQDSVSDAIDVSERALQRNPDDAQANLCLGGAYGLRGRWHAARHHWLRALFDGRRARRYQLRAAQIDPNLEDAYMGVGMFDYYVAALPKIVQALSFLGHGDRLRGLEELNRAASRGLFSKTAARLALIGIYANTEKTPGRALEIARQLRVEYPRSPFMHELLILILYDNQKGAEMRDASRDFIVLCSSGTGFYSPRFLTRGYDHLCAAQGLLGDWSGAVKTCAQAINIARPTDPYLTSAYLHRGEAYDMLGWREPAVADYKRVLKGARLWETSKDAERYLEKPYKPAPPGPGLVPSLDNQP